MSIIIFIVVTILSYIVICSLDSCAVPVDHLNVASSILIGLGSAIWFCLTRKKMTELFDDIIGLFAKSKANSETNNSSKSEDLSDE